MLTYLLECPACKTQKEIVEGMNDIGRKSTLCPVCKELMECIPQKDASGIIDAKGILRKYKGLE